MAEYDILDITNNHGEGNPVKKYVGPFLLMIFLVLLTFLRSDYQHLGLMLLLSIQALLSLGFWLNLG